MTERESAPGRRRLLLGGAATAGAVLLTPALPAEAADGQPLLLGRGNSATAATNLTSNVAGSAASITNTATDKGVGLTLKTVAPNGHGAVILDSAPEGTGAALFTNGIDNRAIRAYNRATHERPVIEATAQRNSAEPADTGVAIARSTARPAHRTWTASTRLDPRSERSALVGAATAGARTTGVSRCLPAMRLPAPRRRPSW